jgi:hypothetical protein
VHLRLQSDSLSFHPVHTQIRAFGPRDLHHAKGRGLLMCLMLQKANPSALSGLLFIQILHNGKEALFLTW